MPLAFRRALGGFLLLLWLVVVDVNVELFGMRGRRGTRDATELRPALRPPLRRPPAATAAAATTSSTRRRMVRMDENL